MTTHDGHNATRGSRPCPATGLAHPVCPDLPLKSCPGGGERVPWNLFVDVHSLGMLPEVIEAEEAATAVALERPLTSVFPGCDGRVSDRYLCAVKRLSVAYLMCRARCSLLVKLRLHGG